MIVAGYLIIFTYVFFLIFVLGEIVKKRFNVETSRKIIHIMLFGVWVLIDVFLKDTPHQIVIPLAFLVLNTLSYKFNIYKSVERTDGNHLGTIYFAVVISVIMTISYLFPFFYYHGGIAIACLTFGDGFAALIGYNIKSIKIYNKKSLAGFLACIISVICSLLIFKVVYYPQLTITAILVLALLSAVLEMVDYGLDNFSITFGTFIVSYFLAYWPDATFVTSVAVALAVFIVVFFAKAIRYYGALLSAGVVFAFAFIGSVKGIAFLLATYFSIFLISKLKKLFRKKDNEEEHPRGFIQILINGGMGLLFMVLYGVTGLESMFIISLIAIGGCFVDSVSSDIGVLSHKKPYDLIKRQYVNKGISGGVSVLGTVSALLFSILIACYVSLVEGLSPLHIVLITAIVFSQSVLDSVLGSVLQEKLICTQCNEITEKHMHCGYETIHHSGIKHINNNAINLISSILVTGIATLIFVYY